MLPLLMLVILTCSASAFSTSSINDPRISEQWGWLRIHCDEAYGTGYHGSGVIVAVLDTGVDTEHPDLKANIINGYNFVDKNNNVTDVNGHGTMVAGIIAAVANNSIGIAGVAPEVKIMPLKVISSQGGSLIDIDLAILYAVNNGARIISMSFGQNSSLGLATESALNYAYQHGCVLIAGAGNDNNSEPFYPAAYDNVIAVSAIDQNNEKASFSNFGSYIDLCAPGVNVLSTNINGTYTYGSGTSFATPFVAGVAALLLSKYPDLTPQEVADTLYNEAEDLGPSGWDEYYGWGLVNAYSAVTQPSIPEFPNTFPLILVLTIAGTSLCLLRKLTSVRNSHYGEYHKPKRHIKVNQRVNRILELPSFLLSKVRNC
jgi:type VII secretion-associated serine protease mycosin